ncbi:hypothetical protein F2Q69_00041587 [Brassica cretica]|uniref:NB-ARC domain-containing protein n=1 Tax=Brassica cretica TaxID=69181 RepID=A0A8S9NK39_BRACR|nr:hypothetical protein F2Q69_00041587 [Brassica cretica]
MKEDLRIDFKGMKINNNKEASKGFLKQISYYKKSPPVERLLKDAKSIFLKERFPESKTILVVIDDNLSGCSNFEEIQDYPPNLKDLYLAGTAIREITSSLGKLTILDLLQYIWRIVTSFLQLPLGISKLKAMLTLKLSGCSKLKSLPNLDATILSGSGHLNTETTMEVPAAIMVQAIMVHHSTIQDSRPGECETPLINLQHKPEDPDLF